MAIRTNDTFGDAALVLVGHGSTVNAESCAPVLQHAGELRRRGLFGSVHECFWKQEPFIAPTVRGVTAPRVFVVPVFISNGYFTEEIIPRELGLAPAAGEARPRVERAGGRELVYCEPVGTHPSMTGLLLARAREVVEKFPFPYAPKPADISLFIAGHGTGRNENSRKAIERQAGAIRDLGLYASVHAVFMEDDPRIADCYTLAVARNIVMTPFFISDGLHSYEDIPVLLGEPERLVRERHQAGQPTWRNPTEKHGKRVWYSTSIGGDPRIADVILERVREGASAAASPMASTSTSLSTSAS